MKHTPKVTTILVTLFVLAQIVGILTVGKYISPAIEVQDGVEVVVIEHGDTVLGPQPEVEDKSLSFIPILIGVLIGTSIFLLFVRFSLFKMTKAWFFFATFITLYVSFGIYVIRYVALALAFILALWKFLKPNTYVHNIVELFIYSGIAIILLPYLNILSISILLFLISLYDMYAVWKSKHMVKMAKFQAKTNVFAGLMIKYDNKGVVKSLVKAKKKGKVSKTRNAILGGGDIAFPLLFTSAVLEGLILGGHSKILSMALCLLITLPTSLALIWLFMVSEKGKFYPAMPPVTMGCFIGYGLIQGALFFI